MRNLVNTVKRVDLVTLIGLTFVSLIIIPAVGFLVGEIINGSFNNW